LGAGAFGQKSGGGTIALEHDPEKHVLDLIGDGNRFSEKIMLKQNVRAGL
jgi:hypothetical protein